LTVKVTHGLGLGMLAMLATAAAFAPAAQAGEFTAGKYPATIIGTNNVIHKITTNLGVMECAPVLHGNLEAPSEELTFSLGYGPCTLGANEVDVNVNGCDYRVHAGNTAGQHKVAGTMDIVCPEGSVIDFEVTSVPTCHLTVPGQTGLGALTYTNHTPPTDVDLDFNLSGLSYTLDMGCPGPGVYANGAFTGTTTLVAFHPVGVQVAFGVD
jgi:hypothetical protein